MLLSIGTEQVGTNWKVVEKTAPGYARIYFVFGGEVDYQDNALQVRLESEHLYLFPTTKPYCMTQNPQQPLNCLYFSVTLENIINELIDIPVKKTSFLGSFLKALNYVAAQKNTKLAMSMCEILVSYLADQNYFPTPDPVLSRTLSYLSEHAMEDLSLEELSAVAGYNKQYFIRYFKKNMGLTPHQYLIQFRMREAARLLSQDCSITRTASLTGYSDAKTFGRAFHLYYGMAPGQWRKNFHPGP